MLAFLQYLFAYVIVASASAGGARELDVRGIGVAVLGYALVARIAGFVLGRVTSARDETSLRRLLFLSGVARAGALAVFWLIAGRLGGAWLAEALGVGDWVLVARLVQMAPYFALVAGYAWGFHAATSAMRVGPRTGLGAIADEFRDAALPLAALVPLILLEDVSRIVPGDSEPGRVMGIVRALPALQSFLMLGVLFVLLLAMPFLVRLMVRAKPMPDGPVRRRLEAYAKRVGLGYRDILVWPSGGRSLNAAVIGAFPRFRYVLITDGLLATLGEDEVEAVFAHEAGHARRGHILMFFGFTSVMVLMGLVPGVANVLGVVLAPLDPVLRQLALVLVWLGVVFGWVSRRFEQEADVYGIETIPYRGVTDARHPLSGALAGGHPGVTPEHPFARAMLTIGAEAGALREVTGWRHFSIDDRIEFIRRYLADERVRRDFRKSIVLLRGTLLTVIFGFALAAAVRLPAEIRLGIESYRTPPSPESNVLQALSFALAVPDPGLKAAAFMGAANQASRLGRDDETARWLREAAALSEGPVRTLILLQYAAALERSGRPAGAAYVWLELADRADLDPASRELARKKAAGSGSR